MTDQSLAASDRAVIERAKPELPAELVGRTATEILLGYQSRLLASTALHQVVVCEKSRRIGVTWGIGADAVLTAASARDAGGMDVLYIGYNLDMAREFIDVCGMWARAFAPAATDVGEFLFADGPDRNIQAFRIAFASGFEIVALASRPRSLRGRQGYVIVDEAAFHDDLEELIKAALALLIWGGKVLIISTHDGTENPFNQLVEDVRAKRKPYHLVRITFDEALADGLYRRVCLKLRKPWTREGEAAWRKDIYAFYGDAAGEELDVVPRAGSGTFVPRVVVEARASRDIPVIRLARDAAFAAKSDAYRTIDIALWIGSELKPLLDALDPIRLSYFGMDFGRTVDRSVLWPLQVMQDLRRHTPFVVELSNIPFEQQRQIVFAIGDRLPRFVGAAMDATGNGAYLAEVAWQKFGSDRVEQIKLSLDWYREHMPKLKAAIVDAMLDVPADADIVGDFGDLKLVNGVARVPESARRTGSDGRERHGDSAVAAALAVYAAARDAVEYGFQSARPQESTGHDFNRPHHDDVRPGNFAHGTW